MATKEKDNSDRLTKTTTPVEKELNGETIKAQLQESVDYHNKLVQEKERLLGELNKVESLLNQNIGKINSEQGIINEYFATEAPSDNGAA
jgi:predicted nuclease with TOPRIM domain